MIPLRRDGESAQEYVARLDWLRRNNPEGDKPIVGKVARADGLHSWRKASRRGATGGRQVWKASVVGELSEREREEAITAVTKDLPAARRRSGLERLKSLTDRLVGEAERSYKILGRVEFPPSLMREIAAEMWVLGKPVSEEQIMKMSLEQVRPLLQQYAARSLEKAARTNKHQDLTPTVGVR